jgi:1-acyl-sn-glycerol-3-phosphate acyltransferase
VNEPSHESARDPAPATDPVRSTLLWKIGKIICRIVMSRYFDLKVYGAHHVPATGGVLFASSHQSYLDPIAVAVKLKRPMSYLAKSELFENPLFSWLIRNLNAIPVRQGEGDVGAVKETIRRLQEGHMLSLFPEGTRTPNGEIHPLQSGIGLVIRRAEVPVVPVVIDGSFQAWPRHELLPHGHAIRVMYGPPLDLKGLKATAAVAKIESTLRQMLSDLRANDVSRYK